MRVQYGDGVKRGEEKRRKKKGEGGRNLNKI